MNIRKRVLIIAFCVIVGSSASMLTACDTDNNIGNNGISKEAKDYIENSKKKSKKDIFSLKNFSRIQEKAITGSENYAMYNVTAEEIVEKYNLKNRLTIEYCGDRKVFVIEPENADKTLLDIHGGGYVYNIGQNTWTFYDMLASKSGAKIVIPDYPLASGGSNDVEKAYYMLELLYNNLLYNDENIIIAGDSAGAGLALGFAEYLKEKDTLLPKKLVLISPWVDIKISNPKSDNLDKEDILLDIKGLREIGKFWAGDTDLDDYKVSPINGDLSGLPDTLIFAGTKEILYPEAMDLYKKMKENGVNVNIVLGKGLYHDYVLQDTPEGEEALKKISEFIK